MSIATRTIKAGTFAFFVEQGTAFTVPSAGTVSATAKPGITDSGWTSLGKIEEADREPPSIQDEEEIYAPDAETGEYVLTDIQEGGAKLSGSFTLLEHSPLVERLTWRTQALTSASTQATPNSGKLPKGWLHIVTKDQNGTILDTVELYVRLKLKSALKSSRKIGKPVVEWTALHSTLQTMGFTS
jgi:hypothetical protein